MMKEHPLAYIVRECVPEWFNGRAARQEIISVLNSTLPETIGGMDPREARIKHPEWFDDYEAPLG